jgi:hypothetical protein
MKRLFTILLVVLIILSFGIAFAGKPENGNNKKPENPPCDSNHGHPLANFLKQGKDRCEADADDDNGDDNGNGVGTIKPPSTGDAGLATGSSSATLFVIAGAVAFILAGLATIRFARN